MNKRLRWNTYKAQVKEIKFAQATIPEGKQFHNLTVDIKYEQEKETVLAKGC